MTPKRRVPSRSTSESSSGSSSDSSSSSSSSSGSDSSSSSDSDSSTSQDVSRSGQKQQPNNEAKKSAPVKPNQRKSTDSTTKSTTGKSDEKTNTKAMKQASNKIQKNKNSLIYSSEDDSSSKNISKSAPKRKPTAKPKNSATVTPKPTQLNKPLSTKAAKPTAVNKNTSKTPPKSNDIKTVSKPSDKGDKKPKKKSIFSPENSSESDSPSNSKLLAMKSQAKIVPSQKPRPKASPRTIEKPKLIEKVKPVSKEEKKPITVVKSKPTISSASSATSETSDSSSSSDSDSSADDSEVTSKNQKKSAPLKKVAQRPMAKLSKDNPASDTDIESGVKTVTRKLTRSASTRKSKHVLGKNTFSDTDSDTESTKRSLSRSPVKRAPISTKGKTKNSKRNDAKSRGMEATLIEERKCPLESCDSIGHLFGKQDKHFTIEACPMFHNVTSQMCKDQYTERKKRDENRKKALESQKKSPRAHPTPEQKQYLQKVKDVRSKFKPETTENEKDAVADKSREPDLSNVASEYDLKLFRDAQALGSEKIEEDLKTLPYTKGTKYIEMGKFEMEVWYQSPYPEDYARLPKLYLCEYCLRYMKSRTILQRHVTKCVWRHPPGEEVYRKDKICVWEVDGKRYKQYCQNLCLLAKFFLDHKTLYYDVEPFLFYVMTIVDSEGCHTVGYFSKVYHQKLLQNLENLWTELDRVENEISVNVMRHLIENMPTRVEAVMRTRGGLIAFFMEKTSFLNYNVSCILTLPPYQRQGYGRLLIDFSYLLTRVENKIGSPEKPLSDLGLISYRSYWKDVLLAYLCARPGTQLSIKDISQETAINSYDIVSTLQALGMMKYWKGKHIVLKKQDVLDEYVERMKRRGPLMKEVDRMCLRWTPFVVPQPATV